MNRIDTLRERISKTLCHTWNTTEDPLKCLATVALSDVMLNSLSSSALDVFEAEMKRRNESTDSLIQELLAALHKSWNEADSLRVSQSVPSIPSISRERVQMAALRMFQWNTEWPDFPRYVAHRTGENDNDDRDSYDILVEKVLGFLDISVED